MWENMVEVLSLRNRVANYILISIVILYFILAPGVNILYYGGEDFRYAMGGAHRTCGGDDGFYFMKTLGRPLQAYMDCVVYKSIYSLNQLPWLRFIAVALLGIGMGLVAEWLTLLGFSTLGAFSVAGSLFLIQKLYSDTVLTAAISLPFAVLFVVLGYRCQNLAYSQPNKKRWNFLAALLYLCGMLTYPAMAFFFGSLVLIKLLFSRLVDWHKTRREVLQELILFTLVTVVYFAWASLNMHFHAEAPIPRQYRLHPNFNPLELWDRAKLLFNLFDGGPWVLLFPLSFPYGGSVTQGWLTSILLGGGLCLGMFSFIMSPFFSRSKRQAAASLLQAIIAVMTVLLFCSTFYLIIPNRETVGSRLLFASVASGVPIYFWLFYQWCTILPNKLRVGVASLMIAAFCLLEAYQANLIIMYNALNYAQTFNATKSQVTAFLAKDPQFDRIHYVLPAEEIGYNRFFLTNAVLVNLYGRENVEPTWCSLPRGIPGEEKNHQAEVVACLKNLPKNGVAVTYSRPGDAYHKTPHTLVIKNKSQFLDFTGWIKL